MTPRRRIAIPFVFGLSALGALLCCSGAEAAYRLGPEDKVRLKVFEWRPSQDQVFEWKALNDEFIVSAGGMLAVPLVGDVPASGRTPPELAQAIADRLKQRMNLSAAPDIAADVVQYRPFYVAGDVVHPGPYPYHPGLTVLEAVAIAGGVARGPESGLVRIGREIIGGEGDVVQYGQDQDALLMRRARLRAELAGADAIAMPDELRDRGAKPNIVRLLDNETKIFQARRDAIKTQSDTLQGLKVFLQKEVETLNAQLVTLDTQMQLVNKELAGIAGLVEKGMVIAPRQLALERTVAQIQGDRLSMQTSLLRVQQEISKTDLSLIELRNARATETSTDLRDTEVKLAELSSKLQTSEKLLYDSEATAPQLLRDRAGRQVQPHYAIVREGARQAVDAENGEATSLDAGDNVKVTVPLPHQYGDELAGGLPPARDAEQTSPAVR